MSVHNRPEAKDNWERIHTFVKRGPEWQCTRNEENREREGEEGEAEGTSEILLEDLTTLSATGVLCTRYQVGNGSIQTVAG